MLHDWPEPEPWNCSPLHHLQMSNNTAEDPEHLSAQINCKSCQQWVLLLPSRSDRSWPIWFPWQWNSLNVGKIWKQQYCILAVFPHRHVSEVDGLKAKHLCWRGLNINPRWAVPDDKRPLVEIVPLFPYYCYFLKIRVLHSGVRRCYLCNSSSPFVCCSPEWFQTEIHRMSCILLRMVILLLYNPHLRK